MSLHDNLPRCIKVIYPAPGYPVYEISHPKAGARVALHGAHVMEWTPVGQRPVIYLSPQAVFEQGKAIRGGIPICWPWFGPALDDPALPAHGFARNRLWILEKTEDSAEGVRLVFSLTDDPVTRQMWPYHYRLELEMFIGETLSLDLVMHNTSADTVFITAALHTYLAVGDVTNVRISGLKGCEYLDQVKRRSVAMQAGDVTIEEEVDREYASRGIVTLQDPVLDRTLRIAGRNHGTIVVWNPWIEKSARLSDLPDAAFQEFVCIETANAWRDELLLPPGERHVLGVTLECHSTLDAEKVSHSPKS